MKKRIFSILMVCCVLCNVFSVNVLANEESAPHIFLEDGATWGEIRNGFVYVVTVNNNNQAYITKASLDEEGNEVFEKKFYFVTQCERYSSDYWREIVKVASENDIPWKLVDTLSVVSTDIETDSNSLLQATSSFNPSDDIGTNVVVVPNPEVPNDTLNAIKYKLDRKYGTIYTAKHLFTNKTSYPGYTFTIWENHKTTVTECNSLEFEKKATLGSLAAAVIAAIPGIGTVGAVITVLAEFYNIAASASTLMNQNGNLITFHCKSVLSRYVTVNNGTVTYSSANRIKSCYIHYDTSVVNDSLGELEYESTSYTPSEYSFTSSGYKWLINTAYNNYT